MTADGSPRGAVPADPHSLIFDFGSKEIAEAALAQLTHAMTEAGLGMFYAAIVPTSETEAVCDA